MSKIDAIKKRTMSKSEVAKIEALAKYQGDSDSDEPASQPAAPTVSGHETVIPRTVEGLVTHYFNTYAMKYPAEVAANLASACAYLEGAAMIAKAMREK